MILLTKKLNSANQEEQIQAAKEISKLAGSPQTDELAKALCDLLATYPAQKV